MTCFASTRRTAGYFRDRPDMRAHWRAKYARQEVTKRHVSLWFEGKQYSTTRDVIMWAMKNGQWPSTDIVRSWRSTQPGSSARQPAAYLAPDRAPPTRNPLERALLKARTWPRRDQRSRGRTASAWRPRHGRAD